ncbi:hypothetical protein WM25_20485 [Burkholderia ubonensis]|nr:hypothetical protein WM25_20485 [Burkholderia ubonensis]
MPASINIGIINLAATFSSCLSRVSHPDCRATNFVIQVGDRFEVRVGKSHFAMSADGSILITGHSINISADGPVQINGKDVDIN